MYRYIGIRGHRGSGKSSISYLLALLIQSIQTGKGTYPESIDDEYKKLVEEICAGDVTNNVGFKDIHLETFSDTPISLIYMIFGIPVEDCYDDWKKDNMFINLRTYEYTAVRPEKVWDAKEYFELRNDEMNNEESPHKITNDIWFTLRELISYYGSYVMKYFFGTNVWIKSMVVNENGMENFFTQGEDITWKIYTDVKFTSEVDFIKQRNGIIVNLIRPDKAKKNNNTSTNLKYDTRIDYELKYDEIQTAETMGKLKDLAVKIYNEYLHKKILYN